MFTIAIIGRANVGKSTLFNKLIGQRKAIESKIPGTTRDQNRGAVLWQNKKFAIIDTPGLEFKEDIIELLAKKYPDKKKEILELENNIQKQITKALKIADLIILVIDVKTGLLPPDLKAVKKLREISQKTQKAIILAVNKCDSLKWQQEALSYYSLGLGQPLAISALTGLGMYELIEKILTMLKTKPLIKETDIAVADIDINRGDKQTNNLPLIKIAICGKPNVGKSSLFNALINEERATVSALPHTTRDVQDTIISYKNYNFLLIDTAGLRRKNKSKKASILEKFSVAKSLETIKKSDLCLLLIDASVRLTRQDAALTKIIFDQHKSLIIIGAKWDLVPDRQQSSVQKFQKYFRLSFPYLAWAPILFTAVPEKNKAKVYSPPGELTSDLVDKPDNLTAGQFQLQRLSKILDLAIIIWQNFNRRISQTELNNFLKWAVKKQRPIKGRGTQFPRILKLEQTDTAPPWFKIIIPEKTNIKSAYLNYLEKKLQQRFNLTGAPARVSVGHAI